MHAPRQTLVQQLQRKLAKQEEQASWWSPNQTHFQHGNSCSSEVCITQRSFDTHWKLAQALLPVQTALPEEPLGGFCISCRAAAHVPGAAGLGQNLNICWDEAPQQAWTTGFYPYFWVKTHAFWRRFSQPNQSIDTFFFPSGKQTWQLEIQESHGTWRIVLVVENAGDQLGPHGSFVIPLIPGLVMTNTAIENGHRNSGFSH